MHFDAVGFVLPGIVFSQLRSLMTHHDQLLFDACGAFVGLQRPRIEDADRLDTLGVALYDHISDAGRRRIAAVLSECRSIIPNKLTAKLAVEAVDIAASLLISRAEIPATILQMAAAASPEHARIVAMRERIGANSHDRIEALIERIAPVTTIEPLNAEHETVEVNQAAVSLSPSAPLPETLPSALLAAQDKLRTMMMRQTLSTPKPSETPVGNVLGGMKATNLVARLINLALCDDLDLLATAIADEMAVSFQAARPMISRTSIPNLSLLLKAIELGPTDSFAICSVINPSAFTSREAIARFYLSFEAISDSDVEDRIKTLKRQSAAYDARQSA
jgi:hypothetical protein